MVNLLLLGQTAGYFGSFVVSLCVVVPLSLNQKNFQGYCLLFTTGTFNSSDGSFKPQWQSGFFCGFTLFVGLLTLIVSTLQIARKSWLIKRGVDSSFLSAFIDSVISAFLSIITLFACVFVTKGFSIWCSAVTERFASCQVSEAAMTIFELPDINTSHFFIEMGTVQFGIWTSLVLNVFLLALASRKVFVHHERANIAVSMAKERLRYSGPH